MQGAPETLRDGTPTRRDPGRGFPFSMKDLALPDHLPALRAAGVSCFKVEGRKKSPLYVATTTDYYRKLLDGRLTPDDRPVHEADMQTVFSRPWTRLFVQSHKDKEVADRDTVGHRGTRGRASSIRCAIPAAATPACVSARARAIERHDGVQIDLPILGKPYGFAVDRLWRLDGKQCGRGVRGAGRVARRGGPAAATIRSCRRGADLLLVVAVGETPLSAHPAPGGAVSLAQDHECDRSAGRRGVGGDGSVVAAPLIEVRRTLAGPFTPAKMSPPWPRRFAGRSKNSAIRGSLWAKCRWRTAPAASCRYRD